MIVVSEKIFYPAIFEPQDVGYSVYVPDLQGCVTQGDTLEEALYMAGEAIGLMLEGVRTEDIPQASAPQDIALQGKQFVMVVPFDRLAYAKKYNTRSVKKTLSIPAWLNELALEKNINFSNVLQNALREKLQVS